MVLRSVDKPALSKALSSAFGNRSKRKAQLVRSLKQRRRYKNPVRGGRRKARFFSKHYGPGPHPGTGTPQSVHGWNRGHSAKDAAWAQQAREEANNNRFRLVEQLDGNYAIRDTRTGGYVRNADGVTLSFSHNQGQRIVDGMNLTPNYSPGDRYIAWSLGDNSTYFVVDVEQTARGLGLANLPTVFPSVEAAAQRAEELNTSRFDAQQLQVGDTIEYEPGDTFGTLEHGRIIEVGTTNGGDHYYFVERSDGVPTRVDAYRIARTVGQGSLFSPPQSDVNNDLRTLNRLLQNRTGFVRQNQMRERLLDQAPEGASPFPEVTIYERQDRTITEGPFEVHNPWRRVAFRTPDGQVEYGHLSRIDPQWFDGEPGFEVATNGGASRVMVRPEDLSWNTENPTFGRVWIGIFTRRRAAVSPAGRPNMEILTGWYRNEEDLQNAIEDAAARLPYAISRHEPLTLKQGDVEDFVTNQRAINRLLDRVDLADPDVYTNHPLLVDRIANQMFWFRPYVSRGREVRVEGLSEADSRELMSEVSRLEAATKTREKAIVDSWRHQLTESGEDDASVLAAGFLAKYGDRFDYGIEPSIDPDYFDSNDYGQIPNVQDQLTSLETSLDNSYDTLREWANTYPDGTPEQALFNDLAETVDSTSMDLAAINTELGDTYVTFQEEEENFADDSYDSYDTGIGNGKYSSLEFGQEAFGGHYSLSGFDVDVMSDGPNFVGIIKNDSGQSVGRFQFTIRGTSAYMDLMELSPDAQGDGFASELLLNKAGPIFLDAGIKQVSFLANITVGGYAWAKYPVRFSNGRPPSEAMARLRKIAALENSLVPVEIPGQTSILDDGEPVAPKKQVSESALRELLNSVQGKRLTRYFGAENDLDTAVSSLQHIITPKAIREAKSIVNRVESGDEVMPYEIAFLGSNSTDRIGHSEHNWHVGKMALIGTSWPGEASIDEIKYLFGSQK